MIRAAKHASDSEPKHLVPFGPYGGGQWTGHPIGLFIVLGFMAMGLVAMPETRGLLLISAAGGAILGFLLWLRHR
jgi:hypothetical protein